MNADANQAKSIFLEAVEHHAGEQSAAFLDQACAGQPALRRRVESLLEAHREVGTGPHHAAAEGPAAIPEDPAGITEQPGTIIGPYKLLQQIGEGGMGIVFMAERSEPVRQIVAIKIIKPGMDSRQVIARFEAERQALAMMDHPNIAKVFDAGSTTRRASVLACSLDADMPAAKPTSEDACATENGRPFFVMELVKGVAITKYCDDNQLTLKERLELFIPVCQAVMHAHQKGIIHRDLKPSNVLVARYDDKPVPKVIDFGVAKATGQKLTERTLFTQFGQLVGTLEYMSPEQATLNALDIDTRSDIYSLGVLLYELLTGSTPFEKKRLKETAFDEVLRIIREEEPPTPSKRLSRSRLPSGTSAPRADVSPNADPAHAAPAPGPARQAGPTPTLETIAAQRKTEPAKLARLVRGDLDWIVMKALDKDRNRRYETASAFAADVEHYLKDEPVEACPPSAVYRLRKFVRRKRVALAIVACIFLAVAGLLGGIGWALRDREAREAETMRLQRAREEEISSKIKEHITAARTLIADNLPSLARQRLSEARKLIVDDRDALTEIAAEVEAFEAEQPETAGAFNQLAWLLVSHADPKFHDPRRAVDLAKKAVALAPKVGRYWNTLGVAHYRAGGWQEALAALKQSIKLHEEPDAWDKFFVAMAHWKLGHKDEARTWYDQASQWMETHAFDSDDNGLLRFQQEAAGLLGLPTPANLLEEGRAHARSAQWIQAAVCYAKAGWSRHVGPHIGFEQACVFLLAGDEAAYRRTCAELLAAWRWGPKPGSFFVARACTLAAQSAEARTRAEKIGAQEMAGNQAHWALNSSAGQHYRAGRYQEAAKLLHQCLSDNPTRDDNLLAWLWLALTNHGLGKEPDARKWLDKATQWLDKYGTRMPTQNEGASVHLHTWLEAHVLRREAEALIAARKGGPKL